MNQAASVDARLSRIEDAGLNASAPPQQRWMDGWLLRFSPGKARRARCVNAVAAGRWPVADKLRWAEAAYAEAGVPMVVRITPFTLPADLDADLAARGFVSMDDTRVMVCDRLPDVAPAPLPAGLRWEALDGDAYAEAVGLLRGSPVSQREAHAHRLRHSPVPYRGFAIRRIDDAAVVACGQFAIEAEFVGLYDVFTREGERGQGLAQQLCRRLLSVAAAQGAQTGYLQVEADNDPARHIYRGLGFVDGYRYHYRCREAPGV